MPWNIDDTVQASFEEINGREFVLLFLTIEQIGQPTIRLVNDVVDYIRADGMRYLGCRFALTWLTDSEDRSHAAVSIPNAVSDISEFILGLSEVLEVQIDAIARSNFSDSVDSAFDARTVVGTETVLRSAANLFMRNIRANAVSVEGELSSFDLSSEPAYWVKLTKDRIPGPYR